MIIFLSDGECSIADQTIQDLCRTAVGLGFVVFSLNCQCLTPSSNALSFHAVSFGSDVYSLSLRRMADIALDIQKNAPRGPLTPTAAAIASSYTQALDTVSLNARMHLEIHVPLSFLRCNSPKRS